VLRNKVFEFATGRPMTSKESTGIRKLPATEKADAQKGSGLDVGWQG
jgi:hypothetical protein